MHLASLDLRHFRNYRRQRVEFAPGITLVVGENAQGKSNLVEALYALSSTRSARTHKEQEVIGWGESTARLEAVLLSGAQKYTVELAWSSQPPRRTLLKRARINQQEVRRFSELFGLCRMVLFSVEDLALVTGGPSERRRYLDYLLCKMSPAYLDSLQHYQQVLRQRNEWLRHPGSLAVRDVLDAQLLEWGLRLTHERLSLEGPLRTGVQRYYRELTGAELDLVASYRPSLDVHRGVEQVAARHAEELRRATSLVGPHRDDVELTLGGTPLRAFGSRGQVRCSTLALRLTEGELMQERSRDGVIYLLDDCMSELDPIRQGYVWDHLHSRHQVIVTGTPDVLLHRPQTDMRLWRITAGQLAPL